MFRIITNSHAHCYTQGLFDIIKHVQFPLETHISLFFLKHSSQCTSAPLDTCPPPTILTISPLSSTLDGGTELTIRGSNLGSRFEDVRGAVTLHDSPEANDEGVLCEDVEEQYEVSTK